MTQNGFTHMNGYLDEDSPDYDSTDPWKMVDEIWNLINEKLSISKQRDSKVIEFRQPNDLEVLL